MPYSRNDELPPGVQSRYSPAQQRAFRHAFNQCFEQHGESARCFRVAHSAAQGSGKDASMVDSEQGRDVPTKEREKLAGQNKALPDGSFPIANKSDLRNAIQAFGRASESKKPQVKAHIKRRARALGATDMIPDDWSRRLAMTEETTTETDTEAQNVSLSNVAEKDKKDDDEDDENPFKKKKKSKKKGKKGDKKDDDEKEEKSLHECPHEDCPREEFATERAAEQHLLTVHPQG